MMKEGKQLIDKNAGSSGFGLIETITAIGLFAVFATVGVTTILHSYSVNRLSWEKDQAVLLAQEGVEAARSLKERAWSNMVAGTYGVDESGGSWVFTGSSDTLGDYTRTVTVSTVQRDGSNNIVTSGGTVDSDTMMVTSAVNWSFSPTRNNQVTFSTYLTNFVKSIASGWSSPAQVGSLDLSSNSNGWKVDVVGNYAYVAVNTGSNNFRVVNISNPASPSLVGTTTVSGNALDVMVSGNYAYVATSGTELQVVNITVPAAPVVVGQLNLPGNADGLGIYVVGARAYLVRSSSSQDELVVINVTNPLSPSSLGSIDTGTTTNEIWVSGNYAYMATDGSELITANISNPASIAIVSTLNLGGNQNADTIDGYGSTLALGRTSTGIVRFVDVSNPSSPQALGSVTVGGNVRDVTYDTTGAYLFVASDTGSSEFTVIDSANPSAPSILSSVDTVGVVNGVSYDSNQDIVVGVSSDNSQEVMVFQPQ